MKKTKKTPAKSEKKTKKLTISDLKKIRGGYFPIDDSEFGASEWASTECEIKSAGGKDAGHKGS